MESKQRKNIELARTKKRKIRRKRRRRINNYENRKETSKAEKGEGMNNDRRRASYCIIKGFHKAPE